MSDGRYFRAPETLPEALEALKRPDSMAVAGGQSLLPMLAGSGQRMGRLVSLLKVPELQILSIEDDSVRIGAGVTLSAVLRAPLCEEIPVIAAAIGFVGNHVIRNRASIGGCLAWADPCGEIPMILMAHYATIITSERSIAADEFVTGAYTNVLSPGEIVVEVRIPRGLPVTFEEQLARRSAGRAVLSVAGTRQSGRDEVSFTVGGLVDRPVRSEPIAASDHEEALSAAGNFLDDVMSRYPAHIDSTTVAYRRRITIPVMRRCLNKMKS